MHHLRPFALMMTTRTRTTRTRTARTTTTSTMMMKMLASSLAVLLCAAPAALAQTETTAGPWQTYDTSNGEWRSYAGDIGGRKYSPLDQIDASNFADLELAWEWTTVDRQVSMTTPGGGEWSAPLATIVDALEEATPNLYRTGHRPSATGFQSTPLMVGGVLYFNTPLSQGVAVDATTGETLWVFNPKSYEEGTTPMTGTFRQRGVAYWTDGEGDERIFWGTGNGYVVCVEAASGRPCADFGPDGSGMVDAMVGLPRAAREDRDYLNALLYGIHSPPIVVRDKVIHGSQVADRRITKEAVPGWVRAWDVRTGEHAWDFHTVPNSADEYGVDTWLNESWRYSGNANVWSMLAGDNELGHVYLPTGTATNDYYGVDRLGDNLFSETLVAVDVETGQRVWALPGRATMAPGTTTSRPTPTWWTWWSTASPSRPSRRSASRASSTSSTASPASRSGPSRNVPSRRRRTCRARCCRPRSPSRPSPPRSTTRASPSTTSSTSRPRSAPWRSRRSATSSSARSSRRPPGPSRAGRRAR